jgi:hypothetical protein
MSKKVQSIAMQFAARVIEELDKAEGIRVEVDASVAGMDGDLYLQLVIAEAIKAALQ